MLSKLFRPLFWYLSDLHGKSNKFLPAFLLLPPLRVTFFITKRCNLSCPFCYLEGDLHRVDENELSLREWKMIIDSLSPATVITFTGGEVFSAPHILEILEYLCSKKRHYTVITNGVSIDHQMIDKIIECRPTYFMFSLEGVGQYHDTIRGKEGIFSKLDSNLKYLIKRRNNLKRKFPLVCIKSLITSDNYLEIPRLIKYANEETEVDHLQFKVIYNNPLLGATTIDSYDDPAWSAGNSFSYPEDSLSHIRNAISQIIASKRGKSVVDISFTKDKEQLFDYLENSNNYGIKNCLRPWSEFTIFPNGDIVPCVTMKTLNIRDVDYNTKRVFSHPKYRKFLSFISAHYPFPTFCQGCDTNDMERIK